MSIEKADELPEGWALARLGELLEPGGLFDGPFGSNLKTSDYTDRGVRVIRLENLANLRFVGEKRTFISQEKYVGLKKHTVREDDILVGSFVDGEVRVCSLPRLDTVAIAKADCFCVRPNRELIDAKYLVYQLASSITRDALIGHIHGATRPRITTKQLRGLHVLVCPIAEQRRIVTAVEHLLTRVWSARERLERVPATLKRFRQAVLTAACSGRLTAGWREENLDSQNADELLRSLWAEPVPEDVPEEEIPASWRWVRFGDVLGELKNGLSTKPSQTPPGTPILRINAVRPCEVSFNDLRYLECSDAEVKDYALRDGDLLFTRYNGSLDLLGVCGMVRDVNGRALVYPDKLMRARFPSSQVLPEYCELFFSSPAARDRMIARAKSSAGQNGVSGSDVKAQPLALPPTEEQREIVRRASAFLALADSIEQRASSAHRRVGMLTQAVLARAFRGELVQTEAELARREHRSYEPASEVLARLRSSVNGEAKRSRATKSSKRSSAPDETLLEFME